MDGVLSFALKDGAVMQKSIIALCVEGDLGMNDLISRQDALVAVKDALLTWSNMPEWRDEKIMASLAEVPSVQPHTCVDCIHWRKCKYIFVGQMCEVHDRVSGCNDYCSLRKEKK